MRLRLFWTVLGWSAPVLGAQSGAEPLAEEPVALGRLVVSTATRTERLLSEVPVRTEVVLREDIELRAALNFSQAIELLNGVRVESNCQNCNTSEVQLLGLSGAYNQILFDGIPLLSSLGGVYGIEQVPAAFVDRLEVVKGGGSALYGPGAVAGVINLVPVEPLASGGFAQVGVDVQKGEALRSAEGRVNAVLPSRRLGVSVVAQSSRNGAIDFNGDGYSEITQKTLDVAGFQAWLVPHPRTRVRVNYQYTQEDRRGGNRLDQPEYLANIAESLQTAYHRGAFTWDQVVSPRSGFRLGYAFAYIERASFYGGLGAVTTDPGAPDYDAAQLDPAVPGSAAAVAFAQYGYTENPLHYGEAQFNHRGDTHALAFGVQYKRESVLDENRNFLGVTLRTMADEVYTNTGVYVQDEWTVTPRLDLVLGGRVDQSSTLADPILSPRFAAAYALTEAWKLRAGLSTGFRAPEVFSEDLHVSTLGVEQVRIRNAADLSAERARTALVGVEWRSDALTPRWVFDATGSVTEITDTFLLAELATAADGSLYRERVNASGSRIQGGEVNLAYRPGRAWRLMAGAAYYRSRYDRAEVIFDDTAEGGTTVLATRRYLKTPRLSGVAQAVWSPRDHFDAFMGVKYTGRMDVLNNAAGVLRRPPDFWVVDLGVTHHFPVGSRHLDLSWGVKNLFDERQRDLEVGAERDSDYVYGPRFARSVYAALRYEF